MIFLVWIQFHFACACKRLQIWHARDAALKWILDWRWPSVAQSQKYVTKLHGSHRNILLFKVLATLNSVRFKSVSSYLLTTTAQYLIASSKKRSTKKHLHAEQNWMHTKLGIGINSCCRTETIIGCSLCVSLRSKWLHCKYNIIHCAKVGSLCDSQWALMAFNWISSLHVFLWHFT